MSAGKEIVAWRTVCPTCGATGLFQNGPTLAEELVEGHNDKHGHDATIEPVSCEEMRVRREALDA